MSKKQGTIKAKNLTSKQIDKGITSKLDPETIKEMGRRAFVSQFRNND